MFCCRVLVLLTSVLATAAAACANVFTLFRKSDGSTKYEQTLWYSRVTAGHNKEMVKDSPCDQYKLFFQISEGATVGGAGVGFIVLVVAIVQLFVIYRASSFRCGIFTFSFIAFAACGACVGLLVFGYMKGYCQNDDSLRDAYAPFKDSGYQFAEGFYLICAACGLFLFSSLFQCCA
ncbi:hypothetical protein DQ04_13341000 [Trypanosoma grayi]|uniref:hypothetical protein n=1 Tax=Trypanosoma grayi TaxID=71804 RepID=UPI0004F4031E|nr:hypothetical protein DQ04_13341000 [Trypanosoma grayi]KEG06559.1 hypothetical protein DQ04_13341000 [Trypanosoma grayi]